jgi:hypothetical protein
MTKRTQPISISDPELPVAVEAAVAAADFLSCMLLLPRHPYSTRQHRTTQSNKATKQLVWFDVVNINHNASNLYCSSGCNLNLHRDSDIELNIGSRLVYSSR